MTHLEKVLEDYRSTAYHARNLGDKFERFIKRYLEIGSTYKDKFSHVWLWNDFPERNGEQDTGIDLVAQERIGEGSSQLRKGVKIDKKRYSLKDSNFFYFYSICSL